MSEYLDTVREVERRIEKAEAQTFDNPLPDLDRPVGVPAAYGDHAKLMFDLQVLALQGDITRVITFQLARETSNRSYPEIGVADPHHPTSHHGGDPEKVAKIAKINQFHVSLFAYYLEKLNAVSEGNGTLLDNSLVSLRQRHGQPEHSQPRGSAHRRCRRRGGQGAGRTAHQVRPSRRRSRTCTSRCSTQWACGSIRSRTAPGKSTRSIAAVELAG